MGLLVNPHYGVIIDFIYWQCFMSEDNTTVVTLKVRVTPDFREKIVETAKANNRSMNAEIVHRLEQSFYDYPMSSDEFSRVKISLENTDPEQSFDIDHRRASDPRERRRLAKMAAERAFQDMSAHDLVETIFNKLNSEGTRLTVEEINRGKERQNQSKKIPKE